MFGNGWFDNNSNDNDTVDRIQKVCEQIVEDVVTGWDMTVFGIEIALGQHPELDDNDDNNDDDNNN